MPKAHAKSTYGIASRVPVESREAAVRDRQLMADTGWLHCSETSHSFDDCELAKPAISGYLFTC